MSTNLKQTIQTFIDEHGLSIAGMERQAGLKVNVIRNILRGQSKRPTAETLQALARTMQCSIQDLLTESPEDKGSLPKPHPSELLIEHPALLSQVLEILLEVAAKKGVLLSFPHITTCMEDIYKYTLRKEPLEVDAAFVDWYVSKLVA